MPHKLIEVKNLTKSFAGIKVIDNVNFDLKKGEVHALMGENGAGKSTFMKILMGLLTPDSGEIIFEGNNIKTKNVNEMLKMGVSMIHQEILAIPELSIAQNIFLGREAGFWLNEKEINNKTDELLNKMGVDIDSTTKIKDLSIAQKQMMEIARAISNQAKVIIMDEPTSALSEKEVVVLFKIIQDLKSNGVSIIYISHKLEEIYTISDRITVLRDGKYIATKPTADLDKNALISLMVGREIENLYPQSQSIKGEAVLSVKNLNKKNKFQNINFEVFSGEILGFAGLVGAGRTEIARSIFGLDDFDEGEIELNGQKITIKSPKEAIEKGIGYVSEDRKGIGFIPKMSVKQNISLSNLNKFSNFGFINTKKESENAAKMTEDLKVKASNIHQNLINLSGGNQQKVVLGKVLMTSPQVIILDEPTRGVDIGAKFEIYKLIHQLAQKGVAILLISSELPEILGMSDRIMVISKGKQTAILLKKEATQEKIMQYAVN